MRLIFAFLSLVCVCYQSPLDERVNFDYESEFRNFVQKYNRVYKDNAEHTFRFNTFVQNAAKMLEDSKKMPTAKFGITKFADWTKEEKAKLNGVKKRKNAKKIQKPVRARKVSNHTLPERFDWRDRNVVTPVKDQGQCGSCWTFQTTAVIESHVVLFGGKPVNLSEQELVDCDKLDDSDGCNGGWPNVGLVYASTYGLPTEKAYPYWGVNQKCHARYGDSGRTFINKWIYLGSDEDEAAYQLMRLGPIGYDIYVTESLMNYKSGIWWPTEKECKEAEDDGHAITIVGFGAENNTPYWLIKNSWGTDWGDNGYFKAHRGNLTCAMGYDIGDENGDFGNGNEWFVAITE